MRREIKFRGKDSQGRWLYGDLVHISGKVYIAPIGKTYNDFSADSFEVNAESIGQYTSLKDKNGVEIYEGDILRLDNWERLYLVLFGNGAFYLDSRNGCLIDIQDIINAGINQATVVGNIYDNPELMESTDI